MIWLRPSAAIRKYVTDTSRPRNSGLPYGEYMYYFEKTDWSRHSDRQQKSLKLYMLNWIMWLHDFNDGNLEVSIFNILIYIFRTTFLNDRFYFITL